jgi:hypothetical protein
MVVVIAKHDSELKEFGAVEQVLAAMEAHRGAPEVQEHALHCIMMLSVNGTRRSCPVWAFIVFADKCECQLI